MTRKVYGRNHRAAAKDVAITFQAVITRNTGHCLPGSGHPFEGSRRCLFRGKTRN